MTLRPKFLAALFLLPGILSAGTIGFNGAWAPVDSQGNFINGFRVTMENPVSNDPRSVTASLSADNNTLTMTFVYPQGSSGFMSFGFGQGGNLQPSGHASYDWVAEWFGLGWWEVGGAGVYVGPRQVLDYGTVNTFSQPAQFNYESGGDPILFGGVWFGGGPDPYAIAQIRVINFAFETPEPASIALAALGLVAALAVCRRR